MVAPTDLYEQQYLEHWKLESNVHTITVVSMAIPEIRVNVPSMTWDTETVAHIRHKTTNNADQQLVEVFEFDRDGRLTRSPNPDPFMDEEPGMMNDQYLFFFNSFNKPDSVMLQNRKKRVVYKYDEQHRIVEKNFDANKYHAARTFTWLYLDHEIVRSFFYDAAPDSPEEECVFTYDTDSVLVKTTCRYFYPDPKTDTIESLIPYTIKETLIEYDKDGRPIKTQTTETAYILDEQQPNKLVKAWSTSWQEKVTYNSRGLIIDIEYLDLDENQKDFVLSTKTTVKYQFDEQGNITEILSRTEEMNDELYPPLYSISTITYSYY